MNLTKGMFGSEFNSNTFFGLRCGAMRGQNKMGHNNGWYNKAGEKLGWGDIDAKDFKNIQKELEEGQLFILLGEHDSYWTFVREYGVIGSMCATEATVEAPGQAYVADKFTFAISKDRIYRKSELGWDQRPDHRLEGFVVQDISKEDFLKLMRAKP